MPPFCRPIRVAFPIALSPLDYTGFEDTGLDPDDIRAVHALASIDFLSATLPPEPAETVQQMVAAQMAAIGQKVAGPVRQDRAEPWVFTSFCQFLPRPGRCPA